MQTSVRKSLIFDTSSDALNQTRKSLIHLVRAIIFLVIQFIFISGASGQADSSGLKAPLGSETGIRVGVRPALSYRFVPKEAYLVELLFAKSGESLLFTALYQKQNPFGPLGAYYRYGAGFSIGGWNQQLISGPDMQLGVDYYLPVAPLVLSLDLRPWVRITGRLEANGELAASLRYVF